MTASRVTAGHLCNPANLWHACTAVSTALVPLLLLLLTVFIWASNNVVSKVIMEEASPVLVALVRFTLAGSLIYVPIFLRLHRGDQRFALGDWPRLFILGFGGVMGSLVLHLMGLITSPATDAAVYSLTTPLFVLVLGRLVYGEHVSRQRALGIAAAFGGALVLVIGTAAGFGGGDLRGSLFLLASAVVWGVYTLLSKDLLVRRSPLLVLATANLIASLSIWPVAGLMGVFGELPTVLDWSGRAWAVMVYLVLLMSVFSQWLYVRAIRDLHRSQVSAVLYTKPLFTAVMAAATLGELPTPVTLLSGLLIVAGVWLVNRPTPRPRVVAPAANRVSAGIATTS
ncbi:MAG: DMT family transporter [Chloroflexota bacterium]